MRKIIPTLVFLALFFSAHAQKRFTNPQLADSLKSIYDDVNVIATSARSHYNFEVEGDDLFVFQQDKVDLIALTSNVKYYMNAHYNDMVELINGSVKYTNSWGAPDGQEVFGNYEKDGIFYSDAKIGHYAFDLMYEGTEVTFEAEKKYKDPKYLTKVFFKDLEPALLRTITFSVPENAEIEFIEKNFDGYEISKSSEKKDGKMVYTYHCKDLDALKSEGNSMGYLHYTPHLIVVTKSYQTEGGEHKLVLGSVDDLYRWYKKLVDEVDVDPAPFTPLVKELTAGTAGDNEKIKNIYYWVQENIKYIAFEDGIAGFKPEAPQGVFSNRYGDCKGVAFLTKSMLKEAGFDARLSWIGTNTIPYNYDLPSLSVDNHMICTVFNGDDFFVLDATEKYIPLGIYAERIQGKEMLIEDGNSYIRKTVPVQPAINNLIERNEVLSIDGDNLVGEGQLKIKGEAQKQILYASTNSKVEDKEDLFKFLSVTEYSNSDEVEVVKAPEIDRDVPLDMSYNYTLGNHITSFGNEIFVEIVWNRQMAGSEIEDNREGDYYFGRKVLDRTNKRLRIPKGYKVSHLPKAINEVLDDEISVNIGFKKEGEYVVYHKQIEVGNGRIAKAQFEKWNELVDRIKAIYDDQIVFTRM